MRELGKERNWQKLTNSHPGEIEEYTTLITQNSWVETESIFLCALRYRKPLCANKDVEYSKLRDRERPLGLCVCV